MAPTSSSTAGLTAAALTTTAEPNHVQALSLFSGHVSLGGSPRFRKGRATFPVIPTWLTSKWLLVGVCFILLLGCHMVFLSDWEPLEDREPGFHSLFSHQHSELTFVLMQLIIIIIINSQLCIK